MARELKVGPKGGKYYVNKSGTRVYLRDGTDKRFGETADSGYDPMRDPTVSADSIDLAQRDTSRDCPVPSKEERNAAMDGKTANTAGLKLWESPEDRESPSDDDNATPDSKLTKPQETLLLSVAIGCFGLIAFFPIFGLVYELTH